MPPDLSPSAKEEVLRLIEAHQRRLQKLRVRAAIEGINVPPEVQIEIEDIKQRISGLENQLKQLPEVDAIPKADGEKAHSGAERPHIKVFLSYAREDLAKVEKLYQNLSYLDIQPWMDVRDILPGEQWKSSIQKAIRNADFFLACLSVNSVNKRGFVQKEIKDALEIWREKLSADIYLIPVRLDDCVVPDEVRDLQWVNLFEQGGWERLVQAIEVGIERRRP